MLIMSPSKSVTPPIQPLKPPKLQPGDTIGIVAPCQPVLPSSRHNYELGKKALAEMGFKLKEGRTIDLQHHYSAGTAQEQAADINAMFADPDIKALISASGGHSAIGVLEHLDYDLIRAHPKPFIGMSDMTSYHLALYAKTGLVGFHMDELTWGIGWNWQKPEFSSATEFKRAYIAALSQSKPLGALPSLTQPQTWRAGSAQGHLIGGTLSLMSYQIGTAYFPQPKAFDGAILFWEAVGRPKYDLRRSLFQLKYYGILERISGMLIGTITDIPPTTDHELTEPSVQDIVLEVCQGTNFPIMAELNFGHYTINLPMPIGIQAGFDTATRELKLLENTVT